MNDIQKLVDLEYEYAYLDLSTDEISNILSQKNPLFPTEEIFKENPNLFWVDIFRRPENFYFTCKHICNIDVHPTQLAILQELWARPYPMFIASRGFGKSFLLALYCIIKALLNPGCKIVICGAGFRQSKVIFDYIDNIWLNAPILQHICVSENPKSGCTRDVDRCTARIGKSQIIAIPIGDGKKIRGLRANVIVMDEFASVNREIYETVIAGFAAVSSSPIESVKSKAREKLLRARGLVIPSTFTSGLQGNQSILSGTADYDFMHFAEYWKQYKAIINTRGDKKKLAEIFGEQVEDKFDWRHYSVIRIPYELIPEGFMDEKTVLRAQATVHSSIYAMEYGACFPKDSTGFFRRTLIESATCSNSNVIELPSGPVLFNATLKGDKDKRHVFGIDVASEQDNFSICILELRDDHRRIVYNWTTNRKKHVSQVQRNLTPENDFYSFCARKIRDLMELFPCVEIAMDSQGGGRAIAEALHDRSRLKQGESPIWPVINYNKPQDSDNYPGLHILRLVEFSDYLWVSTSNHGLKKDLEDKALIFPFFDSLSLSLSLYDDAEAGRTFDTLEDCMYEIEEMKNELTTITVTATPSGRERWDTPELKISATKKGRMQKDRYTSLLLANAAARNIQMPTESIPYNPIGMVAGEKVALPTDKLYSAPDWYAPQHHQSFIGKCVRR